MHFATESRTLQKPISKLSIRDMGKSRESCSDQRNAIKIRLAPMQILLQGGGV